MSSYVVRWRNVETAGMFHFVLECSILKWRKLLKINKCSECSFFGEITNYSAKRKGRQGETEQSYLLFLWEVVILYITEHYKIYIYIETIHITIHTP